MRNDRLGLISKMSSPQKVAFSGPNMVSTYMGGTSQDVKRFKKMGFLASILWVFFTIFHCYCFAEN